MNVAVRTTSKQVARPVKVLVPLIQKNCLRPPRPAWTTTSRPDLLNEVRKAVRSRPARGGAG